MLPARPALLLFALALLSAPTAGQEARTRDLEFEVSQVTTPDVTLSPDGDLVFTLLGHLYRVSPEGGEAVQLTRGPFFHKEPAVSPDGATVAVVSDREPRWGDNVYLVPLDGGQARRLTDEAEAGRPAWSPDGRRIAFLAFEEPRPLEPWSRLPAARVRELDLGSGEVRDVTAESGRVLDVTYGGDGALYWVRVRDVGDCGSCAESDVIRSTAPGEVEVVTTLEGVVDQIHVRGEALVYSVKLTRGRHWTVVARPSFDGPDRVLDPGDVARWGSSGGTADRFAVTSDGRRVLRGGLGYLWETRTDRGTSRLVPFQARVTQTVMVGASPPAWRPPEDGMPFEVKVIGTPVLSPDGREVAFSAAGTLWRRSLGEPGAEPSRVGAGPGRYPTYSPGDGRVAWVRRGPRDDAELVVADGWDGEPRVLARGRIHHPSWSSDGASIVFTNARTLSVVDVDGGEVREFEGWPWFTPRLSADGASIIAYRTASSVEGRGLWRIPVDAPDEAVLLESLDEQVKDPLVSADEHWLVFARNADLWFADLEQALADDGLVTEDEVQVLAEGGGLGFSFDPARDAVVFARGGRIFRTHLPAGREEELSAPFTLPGVAPAPSVLRDVRVLLPDGSGFSAPTDVYLVGGRIAGIGVAPDGTAFEEAPEVEAGGRFAVPGLWDAHLHGEDLGFKSPWLAHGVTSHRDPGSPIVEAIQELELDRLEAGPAVLRRFSSGEIFEGFRDRYWGGWHRLTDPDVSRRLVRQWRALGAHFIKAYASLPWSMHRVVAEEAAIQGLPVMAHGEFPEEMVRGVTLGYRGLEHNGLPEVLHDDVLTLLAEAGTYWTPQYSQWIPVGTVLALQDPEGFERGLRLMGRDALPPEETVLGLPVDAMLGGWALNVRQLQRARELGVRILLGTDNYGGPGWVHVELEAFQDAGFTPAEVLRMATLDAARAEGVDEDLGTLEVGKLADLLLLDDDPLTDVLNLRAPWLVMRGGRVVHRRDGS